jgi:hypothetical protein
MALSTQIHPPSLNPYKSITCKIDLKPAKFGYPVAIGKGGQTI